MSAPAHSIQLSRAGRAPRSKRERPCDACRRRKSKCVVNEGQPICAACSAHGQKCTYLEDPQPRKRRVDHVQPMPVVAKRRSTNSSSTDLSRPTSAPAGGRTGPHQDRQASIASSSVSLHSSSQIWGSHVGPTTEVEPMLFGLVNGSDVSQLADTVQTRGNSAFVMDLSAAERMRATNEAAVAHIESLVGDLGPLLMSKYRDHVHAQLPVVEQGFFVDYESGRKSQLDPSLLAAIFALALPWARPDRKRVRLEVSPEGIELDRIAFALFAEAMAFPTLATIQAGLLLMQRPHVDLKTLNAQLVGAAYELGLQVDSSNWSLTSAESGLRKRLAWALYMQDKWCALIHGRPSAIHGNNWAVTPLQDTDFEPYMSFQATNQEANERHYHRGIVVFREMVALTQILSTVLDTLYTLRAMREVEHAGAGGTRLILDRAKPVQIRLKDWFARLPPELKVDETVPGLPSVTGYMQLAYFATEITLHRCIVRSLQAAPADAYLAHICRSAAKTRLISALDFVNRLRPVHLRAFWYFPSRVSFALVGTFGTLLLATAPSNEEVMFYRKRLAEYRWTLGVSSRVAPFLQFAAHSLDQSEALLKKLPLRPQSSEILAQMSPGRPPARASRGLPSSYPPTVLSPSSSYSLSSAAASSAHAQQSLLASDLRHLDMSQSLSPPQELLDADDDDLMDSVQSLMPNGIGLGSRDGLGGLENGDAQDDQESEDGGDDDDDDNDDDNNDDDEDAGQLNTYDSTQGDDDPMLAHGLALHIGNGAASNPVRKVSSTSAAVTRRRPSGLVSPTPSNEA